MEAEDAANQNKRGVVADTITQVGAGVLDAVQETLDFGAGLTDEARKIGIPLPYVYLGRGKAVRIHLL